METASKGHSESTKVADVVNNTDVVVEGVTVNEKEQEIGDNASCSTKKQFQNTEEVKEDNKDGKNNSSYGSKKEDGSGSKDKKQEDSFGIVPWVLINGKWHILAQISYSTKFYDVKIDPFRGNQKGDENPAAIAARETKEESAFVLDFTTVSNLFGKIRKLYHVLCIFKNEKEVSEVVKLYNQNRKLIVEGSVYGDTVSKGVKEVLGIIWIELTKELLDKAGKIEDVWIEVEQYPQKFRLASQVKRMLTNDFISRKVNEQHRSKWKNRENFFKKFSLIKNVDESKNIVSFTANSIQTNTNFPDLQITEEEKTWKVSHPIDLQNEIHQSRKNQLIEYPVDAVAMRKRLSDVNIDIFEKILEEIEKEDPDKYLRINECLELYDREHGTQ